MPADLPAFSVDVAEEGDWVVVSAVGELDLATSPQIQGAVTKVLPDAKRVVIDLTAITFMDSSALRMLTQAQREISAASGELRLVVAPGRVKKVLQLTGLLDVFSVHDTLQAATRPG